MDVKLWTPEFSEVQQQQMQNEAGLEMTLMEANHNLTIQMEKRDCEFTAELEVFI